MAMQTGGLTVSARFGPDAKYIERVLTQARSTRTWQELSSRQIHIVILSILPLFVLPHSQERKARIGRVLTIVECGHWFTRQAELPDAEYFDRVSKWVVLRNQALNKSFQFGLSKDDQTEIDQVCGILASMFILPEETSQLPSYSMGL